MYPMNREVTIADNQLFKIDKKNLSRGAKFFQDGTRTERLALDGSVKQARPLTVIRSVNPRRVYRCKALYFYNILDASKLLLFRGIL